MPGRRGNARGPHSSARGVCLLVFLAGALHGCQSLGTEALQTSDSPAVETITQGTWGGDHVVMEVGATGVILEFDCAHGMLPVVPEVDQQGAFHGEGIFVLEQPGPSREGDTSGEHPARYEGTTDGRKLTLTIFLTDTKETLGPFTLTFGEESRLTKCL